MTDPIMQFRDALQRRGIIPPVEIIGDGKIHRCDVEGRIGRGDGAYLLHLDGVPAGGFQNHRDGAGWEKWRADIGRRLAPVELLAVRQRVDVTQRARQADDAKRHAEARRRAELIWRDANPADPFHRYLMSKGVAAHGVRQYGDGIIVPMRDAQGLLHSLQFIAPDGRKRFLAGGRVYGCYATIGRRTERICIAEGYATAATVHEATGLAVVVAFACNNLRQVAEAIHATNPTATLIVCADDDYRTDGNPGMTKATEAARAVGALLAVPDFGDDRAEGATDFNDLARHRGREAVERAVTNALPPGVPRDHLAMASSAGVDFAARNRRPGNV